MPRSYPNSPITEAVCEFQFQSQLEWDWTIPGLVYQEISSEFPQKRQEKSFELNIAPQEHRIVQKLGGGLSKMQFIRADDSGMVQVGPNLLAINVRAPYPGWGRFVELVDRQLNVYVQIAKPTGFKRLGLRYINKIEFPWVTMETTEFFNYYPHLPPTIEQSHGPFTMRVAHAYSMGRDILNLQLVNLPAATLTYVLDIDYATTQPNPVELKDGMVWVTEAHAKVEEMFEACITDKTRARFGKKE